ncbi:MAG: glycosyltransferase [Anaerolineales bacterium]|nr:glycosyltransferase [Anaerolineales bacterium]
MTLISIITPSYNQAKYLGQTIQSVLTQDYPNIEYIVIDGGSNDGSVDIIKKYQDKFTYWVSEKDKGQAEAINKGFAKANGEIIAWLNSDDYYLPNTISQVVKTFEENPDAVLIYGNMLAVDENGKTFNSLNYKQLSLEDLICFQIIGQPAVFFRKSALQKTKGLNLDFHFLLDHLLWIELAQHGKMLHVNQTWSAARYHAEAKNRAKAAEFGAEAFRILDFVKQDEKLNPIFEKVKKRAIASAYRVNARYLLDGGLPAKALSAWFQALTIHPPTALSRMNIFVSSILNIFGLEKIRNIILRKREEKHTQK